MHVLDRFRLDGKTAIVTGGSGLYGAHISSALAEAGAHVVIASRHCDSCEQLAGQLRSAGLHASARTLDLSKEKSIAELAGWAEQRFGSVDILVNNAVSREGLADLEDTATEGWLKAQQVNGLGVMLLTKAIVPLMSRHKRGSIINIGSIQGVQGPHFPVYEGTGMTSGIEYTYAKWGLVGMTKWLANYYGRFGIRANCISPGGYNPVGSANEITASAFLERYVERTPLGRMADDEDIKGAVVYLASDASSYVTGHNLIVDGGWSSW
ncbi:SDR family oxidoreductase [Paenibacillus sp. J5C_2022]|uniref:SDR family oxidoreductase n=1 Tax=Paenibacillus sp. J5C2022 TaxID=2977129 RepID=UPI0021D12872|nr:SDR family oxidoreductase [Paenibacillus sp. J5C2022]MCU6712623.1 SDR family oxidoreductase [Paenibacillus sp. J5C2022]